MLSKKEFLEQLSRLVAIRTLSGDVAANAAALDYVTSLLSPKAVVKRVRNKDAEILLASNIDTQEPQFGYMVHIDVVAASEAMFTMKIVGDKVFGRGVSDMKFSIPLGIALLNELIETKSKTSFCLAITTDEELGGFAGGYFLANEMNWKPGALIVPDGGDNLNFVEKAKGVLQMVITAKGVSTHASRPWEGKNALVPLCKLVVALEKKYGKNSLKKNWNTTLNFGQLQGGISTNQVCDLAVLKIDFRYPEGDSIERLEQEVRSIADALDPTISMMKISTGLPTFTDVKEPVVQKFLDCLGAEYGKKIGIMNTFGASDARHFAKYNTPVLMIKPMGGDIHCETEFLEIESTMKFYSALRKFLL